MVSTILGAGDDVTKTNGLLYFALCRIKQQRLDNRGRPLDHVTISALSFLALKKPALFQNDSIRDSIYPLLKSDGIPPSARKDKAIQQLMIFATNLLWASHRNLAQWPIEFIKVKYEKKAE